MAKSEVLRFMPRVKLWLVLVLTLIFTVVLLGASHLTHSLTLRVEAYHALYNLLSLIGCLLTMKDAMHHPLRVMALGAVGCTLNALVFCLIGGYTHHQGCFLEMRASGSVWVGLQVTQEAVQAGRRMLSSSNLRAGSNTSRSIPQVIKELLRDNCGLVMVEVCAAVVYWDDGGTVALYIDPAMALASAALLMWFSYPYCRECCHILLQTIPGHIDVEAFQARLLQQFPAIVNIHHLHIWTFTPTKVVATAHVVFKNPCVYLSNKDTLRQFFVDEGVTKVTLQPEYMTREPGGTPDDAVCLLRCQQEKCHERECCYSCTHHPLLTSLTTQGDVSRQSSTYTFKSSEGVCGSGESEVNVVNESKCSAKETGVCESGKGIWESDHSSEPECRTFMFPCLPDHPGDLDEGRTPLTSDQHTAGYLTNLKPTEQSEEHLNNDCPTEQSEEHLNNDCPTEQSEEHLNNDCLTKQLKSST
ncbi:cadmium, cobalt and zinc/H(+)-K(+) antiporter isoform X2 [Cherax quadricarinatus]|uniref:cadmium, cobalt and zinc/H(+)-K(+) antiporter isoform X2 n=1 Tax=Cherax quadricarinatus TaxID=27406 RepID=UPI0023797344|nr:proton-coupled zinc antiporter SLC30A1-like isoform X2 [Cherax quadricarinatus]